jgi:DNA ligase (NAD+)
MTKLQNFLDKCSEAYYAGSPIITDAQFDQLAESIGYAKVGAKPQAEAVEQHLYPMWSLQKFYTGESKQPPLPEKIDTSVSVKLDGAAVSLLYVNGELVRALTRGNGTEGQLITDKLLSSHSLVPHKISLKGVYQITGEIVAPKHIENARNYASGSLNLKDLEEFKTRAISFFAYGVFPYLSETYDQDMQKLKHLGFSTVKETELDKVYPSDGLVFRCNSNQLFTEYGYTSKHPKGAYALKVRPEYVETKLLSVEWQVGKTGKVTPIAILEPVMIDDALVSRATLNNPGFIEALGLQIGDTVAVVRAGMIIPCILHKVEA